MMGSITEALDYMQNKGKLSEDEMRHRYSHIHIPNIREEERTIKLEIMSQKVSKSVKLDKEVCEHITKRIERVNERENYRAHTFSSVVNQVLKECIKNGSIDI